MQTPLTKHASFKLIAKEEISFYSQAVKLSQEQSFCSKFYPTKDIIRVRWSNSSNLFIQTRQIINNCKQRPDKCFSRRDYLSESHQGKTGFKSLITSLSRICFIMDNAKHMFSLLEIRMIFASYFCFFLCMCILNYPLYCMYV